MKTYKMMDGLIIKAETPAELLEKLRLKSFTPTKTLEEFCAELAQRIEEQTSHNVPNLEPSTVLTALLETGLVTEGE